MSLATLRRAWNVAIGRNHPALRIICPRCRTIPGNVTPNPAPSTSAPPTHAEAPKGRGFGEAMPGLDVRAMTEPQRLALRGW